MYHSWSSAPTFVSVKIIVLLLDSGISSSKSILSLWRKEKIFVQYNIIIMTLSKVEMISHQLENSQAGVIITVANYELINFHPAQCLMSKV